MSPAPSDDQLPDREPDAEPSRWERVEALFDQALDLPAAERGTYLEQACGDDTGLRREVLELLAADAGATAAFTPPSHGTMGRLFDVVEDEQAVGRQVGAWTLERLLGSGGMGKVYLARRSDGEFDMAAAVKLVRPGLATEDVLARFRHERSTLARLEHPHIARLLDGGATPEGLPFLVMEYVPGESLDAWCDGRRLDLRARLALLLPVLDAVATAHRQAVVHRDLKPANVLVDHAGTPRLLDFGIAKVLDAPEESIATTRPGERPMTPAYASPEQVAGQAVGTSSDVWSLGVLLCELLTGRLPFDGSAAEVEHQIVERDGPRPSRLVADDDVELAAARATTPRALARALRGDLDAIVRRAMQREPARRYPSVEHLKDDIERHLAGLPILARPDETTYIIGRFVRRHRLAVGAGVAVLIALTVAVVIYVSSSEELRETHDELSATHAELSDTHAELSATHADMSRLSDERRLDLLQAEMDTLWPAGPALIEPMRDWVARGEALVGRVHQHFETLQRLDAELAAATTDDRAAAERAVDGDPAAGGQHDAATATELAASGSADASAPDGAAGGTDTDDTRWWYELEAELVQRLIDFAGEDGHGPTLAAMHRRLALAERARLLSQERAAQAWDEARATIADRARCPLYDGLQLEPRLFLAPLGLDETTGLYSFWHVQTGEQPQRDDTGRWRIDDDSAAVFVLLPGGTPVLGAQAGDPRGRRYDPAAAPEEGPPMDFALQPFFLAAHELTQGQWLRLTGANPSEYAPGDLTWSVSLSHPVEQVSWQDCHTTLAHFGMQLPTEVQWEYAARAGSDTPWFTGDDPAALDHVANLADLTARDEGGSSSWSYNDAERFDLRDGFVVHAPVGSLAPNPFGLYDVHGNVWEWCRDEPLPYLPFLPGDPLDGTRLIPDGAPTPPSTGTRLYRGGGFGNPPRLLRSSHRNAGKPDEFGRHLGVRPAMSLTAE